MSVFFVEWVMDLLYFSVTEGKSFVQLVFPFSTTGFSKKNFLLALLARSAIGELLSVNSV